MKVPVKTGLLTLVLLFLCAAVHAQDGTFIQELRLQGTARPVALETHAGQTLDRARIARDVEHLWRTGWFSDVRVETEDLSDGVRVVFTVTEEQPLRLRRVVFEPGDAKQEVRLEPATQLDESLAHRVAAALQRSYARQGYADARVDPEILPVGYPEADLLLRVDRGPRYRVERVEFGGPDDLPVDALRETLQATRVRRVFPGIPGLWRGWYSHPDFSQDAVDADLARLHSWLLARGYFDAQVGLADVQFDGERAVVSLSVRPGRRYFVRGIDVVELPPRGELAFDSLDARTLCRRLESFQQAAEREGRVDFSPVLEIRPLAEPPWAPAWNTGAEKSESVHLTLRLEAGTRYTLGRIEFTGNHAFSDSTLRRALTLAEGELFDLGELRRSLVRLNRLGFLQPLTENDVRARRDPERSRIHLTLAVKEKPRGQWLLSGPFGPTDAGGPFQFLIGSRLPVWGVGALELSTYYATLNLYAFLPAQLDVLGLGGKAGLSPLLAVQRPYLPGQGWQSGFTLSPQLGWKQTLRRYALEQARGRGREFLEGKPAAAGRAIPVRWQSQDASAEPSPPVGALLCEPDPPRYAWLRTAGQTALAWFLSAQLF